MGNNYTETMQSNLPHRASVMTWADLYSAKFAFDMPFQIKLADGDVLDVEQVVRMIPKRRMVVFGTWRGQYVVAKLFLDPQHAKRHEGKDIAGIKTLREQKIPTPNLLYQGASEDSRIKILFFERIFEAADLTDIWQNKQSIEEIMPVLQSMMTELATQHVLGVLQHDLHFKNFLLTEKVIYTLDGAQIELFPYLLPKKISMDNLALFLSQFGVGVEALQEELFNYYAELRGWRVKKEDVIALREMIHHWGKTRWGKYERKIFRACSDFSSIKNWRVLGMYDRRYASQELMDLLRNPDEAFAHPSAVLLKNGRSSTVVKITLANRELVVKRYNLKDLIHKLRRCLRPTRAYMSWRLAQKMRLFDVATAKPVAFIENRYLMLRGKSYFITEYVSGGDAQMYFAKHQADESRMVAMVRAITVLLRNLAKLDVTHGDLKITNVLIDENEQPVLIDLDGAKEHASKSSLKRAWRKEIKRFLENFKSYPWIRTMFKNQLVAGK